METKFQIVDLQAQYQRLKKEIDPAIQEVLTASNFINGEQVKKFATSLSEFLGCKQVIPCANGTDALQIAFMALGLQAGDEIIVPAFNYVAAAETAALLQLKPVFVDADPQTFNIDTALIEQAIGPKTKAIVPVHLFGQACDMEAIMAIAEKHKLFVIEDNAQAIGAQITTGKYAGKMLGTIGHIGTTSFFPSKNLGCMGDGGALYTNDLEIGQIISKIANHGQKQKYDYEIIGTNSRLDTLQAAILNVKLAHLQEFTQSRQNAAAKYDALLGQIDGIKIPGRAAFSNHVFHQYTIQLDSEEKRDGLKKHLQEKGVQAMIYYPQSLHLQKAYQYLGFEKNQFPISNSLCQRVLSLPMHSELRKTDIIEICEIIKEAFLVLS
jgi:UDP-2-acetamido-2-deoxy-ribo-hexuluronate aminotransferase